MCLCETIKQLLLKLILAQWTHPYQSVVKHYVVKTCLEVDGLTGTLFNKELLKDRASVKKVIHTWMDPLRISIS